jgi:hypothetical protein
MKCKQVHKNFIGYIENTLPGALSTALHDHLDNCPECKKVYDHILATYTVFNKLPNPEINPFFYTKVEQRLKSKVQQGLTLSTLITKKLQPVIASVIIIVGICLGIIVGKGLANSRFTNKDSAILEAYASEYYLSGTNDDSVDAFIDNE